MDFIGGPRQSGKTETLIRRAAETFSYIICHSQHEVERIASEAPLQHPVYHCVCDADATAALGRAEEWISAQDAALGVVLRDFGRAQAVNAELEQDIEGHKAAQAIVERTRREEYELLTRERVAREAAERWAENFAAIASSNIERANRAEGVARALREALEEYGEHGNRCQHFMTKGCNGSIQHGARECPTCDCGFKAALGVEDTARDRLTPEERYSVDDLRAALDNGDHVSIRGNVEFLLDLLDTHCPRAMEKETSDE